MYFLFLSLSCEKKKKINQDKNIAVSVIKDTVFCQKRIKDTIFKEFDASMYNEDYWTELKIYDISHKVAYQEKDSIVSVCLDREAKVKLIKKSNGKLIFDVILKKEDLRNIPDMNSIEDYVINDIDTKGVARTNSLFYNVILTSKKSDLKYQTQIGIEYLKKNERGQINFWSQLTEYVPKNY